MSQIGCLFCTSPLTELTKNEHILQRSIGGSLKSKAIICDKCNGDFSGNIDQILADKYSRVMNALGPALAVDAPNVDVVDRASNKRLRLEPGMIPTLTHAKITVQKSGKKLIEGGTAEHINKIAMQLWNKNAKLKYADIEDAGNFEGNSPLVHEDEFRAVTKMCLEYLYYRDRPMFNMLDTTIARNYVRHDTMPARRICFIQEDAFGYRTQLNRKLEGRQFCHQLGIAVGARGAHAAVLLFNAIPYRIILSETPVSEPKTYLYQRNIVKGDPPGMSVMVDEELDFGDLDKKPDILHRESERIIALCADADWLVNMNCEEHTVESYLWLFRKGRAPGDEFEITWTDIIEAVFFRVERVFLRNVAPEVRGESEKIKTMLNNRERHRGRERVDQFSMALKETLWKIHLEAFVLHKKHVAQPKGRYSTSTLYTQ
jgi:hypothetical protein